MNKLLRKYQKKVLAVLGVLLMIAFVATLGPGGGMGRTRGEVVVAHIGKTPVYDREIQSAKTEWSWLNQFAGSGMGGQRVPFPMGLLTQSLIGNDPFGSQNFMVQYRAMQTAARISEDIDKHPELFLLLQRDAERNGLGVSQDEVGDVLVNRLRIPIESDAAKNGGIAAVRGLLLVAAEIHHLQDIMKVSQPVWRHEAAQQYQTVRLNLVDFRADEFEKSVPAPTPEQLRQHFEKYKEFAPRQADAPANPADPLGFGYRIPPRVKLQYIQIPRAQVVESLKGSPEKQYEWMVQAASYYQSHPDEFRNTPPATAPGTTQPASEPASQPAIKPFEEVKAQIIQKLLEPEVEKQITSIQNQITSELNSDWIAIRHEAPAATRPAATEPAAGSPSEPASAATTLPSDSRMTLAHLERLRADIEQKYHVAIDLHEFNDWQDEKQLGQIPGIGTAHTPNFDEFPRYALTFTGQPVSATVVPLQVWEPSQPLTDAQQNAYIFRLTAAEPSHPPKDMAPIAKQVEHDWRLAQAYELAKQAAQKLLDASKSVGLAQAARTGSLRMITTGDFSPSGSRPIPNYPLTDTAARQDFGQGAQKLLDQLSESDKHPEGLIELPTVQRALVAELAGAQLAFPEWLAQLEITATQRQQQMEKLAGDWFSYESVVSRLGYKPEEKQQGA